MLLFWFYFKDILWSNELLFLPQHLRDLCLSISPWSPAAFQVSLPSCWQNLHVIFQYILTWPSHPSMVIQFFFLSTTDTGLKAAFLTPWWQLDAHYCSLRPSAFRLECFCTISDNLTGKCLQKTQIFSGSSFLWRRCNHWLCDLSPSFNCIILSSSGSEGKKRMFLTPFYYFCYYNIEVFKLSLSNHNTLKCL